MSRAVSLALALPVSAVLLVAPFLLAHHLSDADHGLLSLMMIGLTGALVHGMGYVPRARVLRLLFSPAVAWPLVLVPGAWLLCGG
jgi:predicted membrane protein